MGFVLGLVLSAHKALNAKDIAQRFLTIARSEETLGKFAVLQKFNDSRYYVSVLPITEAVRFEQKKGKIYLSARTSTAGPGYHDYLTGLLDDLISLERLAATETGEYRDEADYWADAISLPCRLR